MQIDVADNPDSGWDGYVRARPGASIYLLQDWSLLARDVFGHRAFFLHARGADGALSGVLPLVQQRGLLGNFATSVPFFNYGGALADDQATAVALMERARELARERGCSYLELRDVEQRPGDWQVRTDKVSMLLDLPASVELLGKQLGSKLRSQIKRAEREVATVRTGGLELLPDFYGVFARNMRDLGTPVYPVKFFRAILERQGGHCQIVVIDHGGRPAAAGFLIFDGAMAEIPWAACRAEAKPLGFNMRLYWELLKASLARGCTRFDFGRSTTDSGTFKFKQQWGAQPRQLYWHRWERHPSPEGAASPAKEGRVMRLATSVWQRLPVPVANFLGPLVSPGLPW